MILCGIKKIDVNDESEREGGLYTGLFKYSTEDYFNGRHAAIYVVRSTERDFVLRDSQDGIAEWAALSVALEQYSNERVPF